MDDSVELVQMKQIAEILDVERQWADQLSRKPGFPHPAHVVNGTRIYLAQDIRAWNKLRLEGRLDELGQCPTCGQRVWPERSDGEVDLVDGDGQSRRKTAARKSPRKAR